MAQVAFGKLTSWDDASVASSGKDYMNMKEDGDYPMRVVTDIPYEYPTHWIEEDGKGTKVKCAGRGCILCGKGNEQKITYAVNVINRTNGRCQVFEFGKQIYDQLHGLAKSSKWGDLRKYDININKKKGRKPMVYQVTPEPPLAPLSDAEIVMVKEFMKGRGDLDKISAPLSNDDIRQKLAKVFGTDSEYGDSGAFVRKATESTGKDVSAPTTLDTEFDFSEFDTN